MTLRFAAPCYPHYFQNIWKFAKPRDGHVRVIRFRPERILHPNGLHTKRFSSLDISIGVIANEHYVFRSDSKLLERTCDDTRTNSLTYIKLV